MSNHGWLRGEYKIPTKEWTNVKRTLRTTYNRKIEEVYQNALLIHSEVSKRKKGKRNINLENLVEEVSSYYFKEEYYWIFKVTDSLVKDNKLVKPKKKDFSKANSSTNILCDEELTVSFEKGNILKFHSDDNSHSQSRCLQFTLGKAFLRVINNIEWTSKSGGYLRYFDEHLRDDGRQAIPQYTKGKYSKLKYFKQIA